MKNFKLLLVQERNNDWFPRMQAMSLAEDSQETEQPDEIGDIRDSLSKLLETVKKQERQLEELKQVILLCKIHDFFKNILVMKCLRLL